MNIKQEVKEAAKRLGIDCKLKKAQAKAINDGMSGRDLLVIAPTGFGKSAIFQILTLLKQGVTLVVVPTLSLLHDQVDKLQQLNISAGCVCSDAGSWDEFEIKTALGEYGYALVYTTPESLWKLDLTDTSVSMVVIDECHCVTAWGYGFREAYLEIGSFIDRLSPRPVVIAMTATAPIADRKQIVKLLGMNRVKEHTISLYRPKLTFIRRVFTSENARQKDLKRLLKRHMESDGSCIIYCNTKGNTDKVYDLVRTWYPGQTARCRSNLPSGERKRNERAFMDGEKKIMVATSAFGMGVDKSDVRLVIHYNLTLSLIDYYQQAGRAGRDGGKAKCILLYNKSDYNSNRFIIEQNQEEQAVAYSLQALDAMKEYADDDTACMVQRMLSALGEDLGKPCGRCTNCQKGRKRK